MDGIHYYGFEQVTWRRAAAPTSSTSRARRRTGTRPSGRRADNVSTNAAAGTSGDDRVYLSSNANLDGGGTPTWHGADFLTGNLDDFQGALNIDLGTGRHRLFLSDEGSTNADSWAITRSLGDPFYSTAPGAA